MTRKPIFSSRARTAGVVARLPRNRLHYRLLLLRSALRRMLPFTSKAESEAAPTVRVHRR